jgi:hypothetical protein
VAVPAQLLPGTLDLLILKAVSLDPLHGYGVLLRIGQISDNALLIEQASGEGIHDGHDAAGGTDSARCLR